MAPSPVRPAVLQPSRLPPSPPPPVRHGLVIQCKLGKYAKLIEKSLKKNGNPLGLVFNSQDAEDQLKNFDVLSKILNSPHGLVTSEENLTELCGIIEGLQNNNNDKIYWQRRVQVKVQKLEKQEILVYEDKRVEEFYQNVKITHDPQNVKSLGLVNGRKIRLALSEKDLVAKDIDEQILAPDKSKVVTDTLEDGEISPLQEILKGFVAEMRDKSNEGEGLNFTVELAGRDGACDGCKKRIAKFLEIWREQAVQLLLVGVTATLTLTYKYKNEAYEPRNDGNVYGWDRENDKGGWIIHREQKIANGTRKKQEEEKSNSNN